ncbi:unnamed protein product [Phaeothamnion confervicola]
MNHSTHSAGGLSALGSFLGISGWEDHLHFGKGRHNRDLDEASTSPWADDGDGDDGATEAGLMQQMMQEYFRPRSGGPRPRFMGHFALKNGYKGGEVVLAGTAEVLLVQAFMVPGLADVVELLLSSGPESNSAGSANGPFSGNCHPSVQDPPSGGGSGSGGHDGRYSGGGGAGDVKDGAVDEWNHVLGPSSHVHIGSNTSSVAELFNDGGRAGAAGGSSSLPANGDAASNDATRAFSPPRAAAATPMAGDASGESEPFVDRVALPELFWEYAKTYLRRGTYGELTEWLLREEDAMAVGLFRHWGSEPPDEHDDGGSGGGGGHGGGGGVGHGGGGGGGRSSSGSRGFRDTIALVNPSASMLLSRHDEVYVIKRSYPETTSPKLSVQESSVPGGSGGGAFAAGRRALLSQFSDDSPPWRATVRMSGKFNVGGVAAAALAATKLAGLSTATTAGAPEDSLSPRASRVATALAGVGGGNRVDAGGGGNRVDAGGGGGAPTSVGPAAGNTQTATAKEEV